MKKLTKDAALPAQQQQLGLLRVAEAAIVTCFGRPFPLYYTQYIIKYIFPLHYNQFPIGATPTSPSLLLLCAVYLYPECTCS